MTKEEIFKELGIKVTSLKQVGKVTIIATKDKKYAYKEQVRKADFYDYLLTRNFNYFPRIYTRVEDEIELMDYILENETPKEQKLEDISYLVSILHGKTVFDKIIDTDNIKEIYESIIEKQNNLLSYYQNLQDIIEQEVYMSPANYLLIRNMSLIYVALNKSREYIDTWYNMIKNDNKIRYSYIHGNLKDNHLIEANNLYLISWDLSRIDFPIYDLEKFYKNSYKDISIKDILNIYEVKFPLKKEEKYFLFSLLLIPDKIDFKLDEYPKIKQVSNLILYLNNTLTNLKDYSKKANNNTEKQN